MNRRGGLRIPDSAQSKASNTCVRKSPEFGARRQMSRVSGRWTLNLALSPTREMLCAPSDLAACFVETPEYRGPTFLAFDIGEAGSGTAAVAFWPTTGALKTWLAFGSVCHRCENDPGGMERITRRWSGGEN